MMVGRYTRLNHVLQWGALCGAYAPLLYPFIFGEIAAGVFVGSSMVLCLTVYALGMVDIDQNPEAMRNQYWHLGIFATIIHLICGISFCIPEIGQGYPILQQVLLVSLLFALFPLRTLANAAFKQYK